MLWASHAWVPGLDMCFSLVTRAIKPLTFNVAGQQTNKSHWLLVSGEEGQRSFAYVKDILHYAAYHGGRAKPSNMVWFHQTVALKVVSHFVQPLLFSS